MPATLLTIIWKVALFLWSTLCLLQTLPYGLVWQVQLPTPACLVNCIYSLVSVKFQWKRKSSICWLFFLLFPLRSVFVELNFWLSLICVDWFYCMRVPEYQNTKIRVREPLFLSAQLTISYSIPFIKLDCWCSKEWRIDNHIVPISFIFYFKQSISYHMHPSSQVRDT